MLCTKLQSAAWPERGGDCGGESGRALERGGEPGFEMATAGSGRLF